MVDSDMRGHKRRWGKPAKTRDGFRERIDERFYLRHIVGAPQRNA